MAGGMGWSARELADSSLAEVWAHWIGHAQAQGWLDDRRKLQPAEVAEIRRFAFGEAA